LSSAWQRMNLRGLMIKYMQVNNAVKLDINVLQTLAEADEPSTQKIPHAKAMVMLNVRATEIVTLKKASKILDRLLTEKNIDVENVVDDFNATRRLSG